MHSKQDPSCRESDYRTYWLARNQRILDWLLYEKSSIICLQVSFSFLFLFFFSQIPLFSFLPKFLLRGRWRQEFWVGNQELVNIYENRLGNAGYINFKLARTNNRGDGAFFFSYSTFLHSNSSKLWIHTSSSMFCLFVLCSEFWPPPISIWFFRFVDCGA